MTYPVHYNQVVAGQVASCCTVCSHRSGALSLAHSLATDPAIFRVRVNLEEGEVYWVNPEEETMTASECLARRRALKA